MCEPEPKVLYEDNHLLALLKPAGTLTLGDETGDRSMVDIAAEYLRTKYNKPGNVFVGVVHRLDRPVSGVLLLARTSKAASRLSEQFRSGSVRKVYDAVVSGKVSPPRKELVDWLVKDRRINRVKAVSEGTAGARRSVLTYEVLSYANGRTLLQVEPVTGRSHQIRVQLATRSYPIIGDVKYGSTNRLGGQILLHARTLEFDHPTQKHRVTVSSPAEFDV